MIGAIRGSRRVKGVAVVRRRKRPTKLGWRWRRNPLRRRSDVVEGWLGVLTALLFCTAPVIGWWAGQSVDRTLQRVVRTQRAERTLVSATAQSPKSAEATSPSSASAGSSSSSDPLGSDSQHGDTLRWTAPDHSVHTATVSSDLEVWQQHRIMVWTDHKGALVPAPLDSVTATTHSVLAGLAAASAAGGLLLISRQVLLWRLMLRRMASWEREWARVGQDWGRAGAGG
jgi:plastocyanin